MLKYRVFLLMSSLLLLSACQSKQDEVYHSTISSSENQRTIDEVIEVKEEIIDDASEIEDSIDTEHEKEESLYRYDDEDFPMGNDLSVFKFLKPFYFEQNGQRYKAPDWVKANTGKYVITNDEKGGRDFIIIHDDGVFERLRVKYKTTILNIEDKNFETDYYFTVDNQLKEVTTNPITDNKEIDWMEYHQGLIVEAFDELHYDVKVGKELEGKYINESGELDLWEENSRDKKSIGDTVALQVDDIDSAFWDDESDEDLSKNLKISSADSLARLPDLTEFEKNKVDEFIPNVEKLFSVKEAPRDSFKVTSNYLLQEGNFDKSSAKVLDEPLYDGETGERVTYDTAVVDYSGYGMALVKDTIYIIGKMNDKYVLKYEYDPDPFYK